jgi:nuclear pore complex protein Nup160
MDYGDTPFLYKETRLSLEPEKTVVLKIPSTGRNHYRADIAVEDEAAFRQNNLAIASSIYRRKWHDSPRSILWRVLGDGTVLSIRAFDVCQKSSVADTNLVLNFHFTVPIQPSCVVFTEPKEHDALGVFVLDQANQLYSFMLRPDMFRKKSALDSVLQDLAKVQALAGLGFKHAHRMVAVSEKTLLVTVNDGGMIRLDREKSSDCTGFLLVARTRVSIC